MHRLRVAIESHFVRVDGRVYTRLAFDYPYWSSYLDVFDGVEPVARVRRLPDVPSQWVRADGPGVVFNPVRDYVGFWQFLGCWPSLLRDCSRAVRGDAPVLLRMGNVALFCWLLLALRRRPYAFEVVGHAGEGARQVRNVQALGLNRLICWCLHRLCERMARGAYCASYVSEYVRRLYPTKSGREWVFSSVTLKDEAFASPRDARSFAESDPVLVSVGRLEPEKGHHILVEAVASLRRTGFRPVHLKIAGPGREMQHLRHLAERNGIADRVELLGRLEPGPAVRDLLDRATLFVLPSLTEGMPRALLEAMARGLPAIGSRAGGIVEILPDECLVRPGDASELAAKLREVLSSPIQLAALSALSVVTARNWRWEEMQMRKQAFWQCIRAMTRQAGTRQGDA